MATDPLAAETVLRGLVRFPAGQTGPFARLRVSLRDVGTMDGPAETVAYVDVPDVLVPPEGGDVPFQLRLPAARADAPRTLAWRAHADRTADGEVKAGDLVTTTTMPCDLFGTQELVLTVVPV